MKPSPETGALRISTPGRICLFGEHQDYLGLPVIPAAIALRVCVEGAPRDDREVVVHLPDIGSRESFSLDGTLAYRAERDYLRSAVNVVRRAGFTFGHGLECTVHGTIPINSGTSSSSALIVSWINFLLRMSDQRHEPTAGEVATLAHRAEVLEFGEPGGMMDHFSTAYGGILAIDFQPDVKVEPLRAKLGTFVLGDSHEPKDTTAILARVKEGVLQIVRKLVRDDPALSLSTISPDVVDSPALSLTPDERTLLAGTLRNRDLTREARRLLSAPDLDHHMVGVLLNRHQDVLRDTLKISTPKIDRMLASALDAGAYGGKINGSGGGGCMFVYAPEDAEAVAHAIEHEGGTAYVTFADEGTRVEAPQGLA